MQHHFRYVPFIRNVTLRTAIGFILLVASVIFVRWIFNKGRFEIIVLIATLSWIVAVFLTDKYVHKYPQRYFTYLIASHMKFAIIMAFFLWLLSTFINLHTAPPDILWTSFILFVIVDALVSVPRRRYIPDKQSSEIGLSPCTEDVSNNRLSDMNTGFFYVDKHAIVGQIHSVLDKPLVEFIENNLPEHQGGTGKVLILDDVIITDDQYESSPVDLLIGRTRINDVRRLNQFMRYSVGCISMGGYLAIRYMPLENVAMDIKNRYPGILYWPALILHFIWFRALPKIPWLDTLYFSSRLSWLDTLYLSIAKKRNRVLSRAEVWGRLSYCGMEVIAESEGVGEHYIIAQRKKFPLQNKLTSYYLIASLEKVGLDGNIIHMHKIRTMFPFSEFIQQRIFEDHGLASNGKFAKDFRLTEYGRFLRKYWLDELPQVFDWLRGDIKLVGMRATSPHFLSLYPKEFYNLYIQIKPGFISPIFDENTNGFDHIVEIELAYLKNYWEQPIWTDIRYFFKTFTDIVFRGVRSK